MTDATPPKPPSLTPLWGMVGIVILVRVIFWGLTGLTIEDSLISLRYAENLAAGHGLVYNAGERVFGASTPLYVLLLAGLVKVGLPALAVAKVLAVIADGATAFLWGRWLLRETGGWTASGFFGLLFGLSAMVVPVTISGMETSFALLLLSVALTQAMGAEDQPERRVWLGIGVPLGLLMLVRPDGALAAAVILGLRWARTRRLPVAPAATAALIVLPWAVTALWYYGTPVPNSIPAKAAAYNAHQATVWPNLYYTLGEFLPVAPPWWRALLTALLLPFLAAGLWNSIRSSRLRPLGVLLLVWWAYLVLPRTLLFTWYFPLLLLPAYALTAYGFGLARTSGFRFLPPDRWAPAVAGWVAVVLVGTLYYGAARWRRVQLAERRVRTAIGLWLRENTPERARIAMEPIGYIGYYSRRRILDQVGLVSPEMISLNRAGDGWFGAMLRREAPDYVVERPAYLLRNYTLNSGVRLFASRGERDRFLAEYEPLAVFGDPQAPRPQDYRFVVFGRRGPASAEQWAHVNRRLTEDARRELRIRSLVGPVDLTTLTVGNLLAAPDPGS